MEEIIKTEEIKIEDLIYEIRGKQVMLDSDLAKLYKTQTKRINEAVKNNPNKFPERFSWKLNDHESKVFLVENFDQKNIDDTRGGKYKNPRVFTEQGVAMLATILKTKIAVETSIKIMDAFVLMKKYISNDLLIQKYYNDMTIRHDSEIKTLQKAFNQFVDKKKVNDIYYCGQIYDAYATIQKIFNEAKKELIIIDSYADNTILDIIKRLNVKIIIITKENNLLTKQDIFKYNKEYHNLKVIFNNTFHDRYFIIDKKVIYHCGGSVNRIGYKTFSINLISDKNVIDSLILETNKIIKER